LIRVPLPSHYYLDVARILIMKGSDTLAIARVNPKQGAALVGKSVAVYQEFITRWQYELAADSIHDDQFARCIMRWSRPVTVSPRIPIVPEQVLSAQLVLTSGKVVAEETFTVGGEHVQDILLASKGDQ
jgi:hypothetical protein